MMLMMMMQPLASLLVSDSIKRYVADAQKITEAQNWYYTKS